MAEKSALIAGATGLVGSKLIKFLLKDKRYTRIIAIVRTPLNIHDPKLKEVIVKDFGQLEKNKELFMVDDVFCCLGTTIKKAKTKEAMYRIDVEFPLIMANLAKAMGTKQFLIISSMNADPSSFFWYQRMKGELEGKLKTIGLPSLHIVRPSLLLGNRKEFRFGEKAAEIFFNTFSFVFKGPLKKVRAINDETVAMAMLRIAETNKPGTHIYSSAELQILGK